MLPDILAPDLNLVICGSAAGAKSAHVGSYYAGPGNSFWRTLATIGLTPRQLAPAEYRLILTFGIGLTDLVKHQAGSDNAIRFGLIDRARLEATVTQHRPRFLCFNGKRAALEYFGSRELPYGLQSGQIGGSRVFVAPSTSGAARRFWDLSVWQTLATLVRE